MSVQSNYNVKQISFLSHGTKISGLLFQPAGKPKGTITIFGPIAFVKEQSPVQYAARLAKEGFMTLIYDPRYYGESEGTPRQFEDRKSKVEDIIASVDYLLSLDDVSKDTIYALGVCQGTNWIAEAATKDKRIKKVMLVASALLSPAMGANYLSRDEVEKKIERGRRSREKYEKTGEIDYMHIGLVEGDDMPAIMPFQHITNWYGPWELRTDFTKYKGKWENKITQMSEELIWGYDVSDIMSKIIQPVVMIHSDKAASGPITPKQMFEKIPSKEKKLIWFDGDQVQYQFYEDPITVDKVVFELTNWL
ncbi:alpha/beta fold hydrolase [Chryseobacterium culicis]|nr:alpha/beta fold hydrolase [Chryseobacterium culicis]